MSLANVVQVYVVPDSDRAQQTDKEQSTTVTYRVEFDAVPFIWQGFDATDGTTEVPPYGAELEIGSALTGMYVNNISPQRNAESPNFLDVYVTFSTLSNNPNQTGKWNTDISVSGVRFVETTTRYDDGSLIINSAGDLYDPMQNKIYYDEKISVSFTTDSVDGDSLATLRGKVNTVAITMTVKGITRNFAINTLLMDEISYKVSQTGATGIAPTFSTYSVTFDMIYRIDTWIPKLVDQGTRDKNHKPFQNGQGAGLSSGTGNDVTAPIYMDGNGGALIGTGSSFTTPTVSAVLMGTKLIQGSIDFTPFLAGIE